MSSDDSGIKVDECLIRLVKSIDKTNCAIEKMALGQGEIDRSIVGLKIRLRIVELMVYGGAAIMLAHSLKEMLA